MHDGNYDNLIILFKSKFPLQDILNSNRCRIWKFCNLTGSDSQICSWSFYTHVRKHTHTRTHVNTYSMIEKVAHKFKELIEKMKCNNFTIGTHGLRSNSEPVQGWECMHPLSVSSSERSAPAQGQVFHCKLRHQGRSSDEMQVFHCKL